MRNEVNNRRRIRNTTLVLVAIALAFYLGFILMGAVRA